MTVTECTLGTRMYLVDCSLVSETALSGSIRHLIHPCIFALLIPTYTFCE